MGETIQLLKSQFQLVSPDTNYGNSLGNTVHSLILQLLRMRLQVFKR